MDDEMKAEIERLEGLIAKMAQWGNSLSDSTVRIGKETKRHRDQLGVLLDNQVELTKHLHTVVSTMTAVVDALTRRPAWQEPPTAPPFEGPM